MPKGQMSSVSGPAMIDLLGRNCLWEAQGERDGSNVQAW